jgi:hypothetical protein
MEFFQFLTGRLEDEQIPDDPDSYSQIARGKVIYERKCTPVFCFVLGKGKT